MTGSDALEARLWSKVDRRGPDECWPWVGTRNEAGYGVLHLGGRNRMAHRLTFEAVNGPIPCRVAARWVPAKVVELRRPILVAARRAGAK